MLPRSLLLRNGPIYLIEPEINPIAARTGLAAIATYPPLAQARLAGQISDEKLHIFDLRIRGERKALSKALRRDPPALVGISTTFSSNGEEAIRLAQEIRLASPDSVLVMGGTAVSEEPMAFWEAPIDFIGFRSGDSSLPLLVQELRQAGAVPERPPGFFYRNSGQWEQGPCAPASSLSSLKPFAWHLLPKHYWKRYHQVFRTMGMSQMSEGCPYDCNFCSVWITHGKRIEVASLENIQHDFQSLPSSIWGMFFADDIWMQGTEKQLRSLYDPLLNWLAEDFYRRRPDFALTVETRTDLFLRQKARFADWTRRGKLLRVFFGVEAVTNEALDAYSKRTTVNHNSEAIRQAAELGLSVVAQLVIPLDADRAYFDEIVRFVDAHRPWIRTLNFTVATPLPGTELYQDLLKLHPDLSDRKKVRHPAFSLYTALTPTRLSVPEFYEQVARLFRIATAVDIFKKRNLLSLKNLLFRTPRLIPRVLHSARLIKALSQTETYLQMHRDVQGERLLGGLAA